MRAYALIASFVVAMLAGTLAQAEDARRDLAQGMAELESEMAGLQGRLDTPTGYGCGCGDCGCGDCGCGCDVNCGCNTDCGCCQPGGLVGGFEWTQLWVYGADRVAVADDAQDLTGDDDSDFAAATALDYADAEGGYRFWAGYEDACGLGVRARYWDFDATANRRSTNVDEGNDDNIVNGLEGNVELSALDIEVTQRGCFRSWSFLVAGGVRRGRVDLNSVVMVTDNDPVDGETYSQRQTFEGWGPTAAIEARRPIGCTSLTIYTGLRGSLLFGDGRQTLTIADTDDFDSEFNYDQELNTVLPVIEAQVGVEWNRCTAAGNLFLRVALEGQAWLGTGTIGANVIEVQRNDISDGRLLSPGENIGVVGFAASVGLDR